MGQKMSGLPTSTDFIRENPFDTHRDDLEQHRLNNVYLGRVMFWRNTDQLPTKHIYHTDNVEYRNMKLMMLEMLFYILNLTALTVFVTENSSSVEYETRDQQLAFWRLCTKEMNMGQSSGSLDSLPKCSLGEDNADGFYRYMRDVFTPILFNQKEVYPELFDQEFLYDLDETSKEWAPRYLGDTRTTVLLGSVRARQLRVLPNRGCRLPENLTGVQSTCYAQFHEDRQSRKMYAKRRIPPYIRHSYVWEPRNKTEMIHMSGLFGVYPGDGFLLDFPLNRTRMLNLLRDLQEWSWCDVQTRAVIVEVNTFNPNINLIAVNRLLFEFGPTGQVRPSHDVFVLPTSYLTLSTQGEQGTLFGLQVLVMVSNVFFALYHAVLAYKDPISYLTYTWNMIDVVNLSLFVAYVYYRTEILSKYGADNKLQPELAGMPNVYMPYVQLEFAFHKAQALLAWHCLFSWVRVLKYLSLSSTFRVLIRTLEAATFQLAIFSLLYLSVTVGFSIAFVVGFGAADTTEGLYSSFGGCFFILFFMLVGGVDLEPILGRHSFAYLHNRALAQLLFMAYLVLVALLFFKFFMAIVIDTYSRVNIQLGDYGNMRKHEKKNPMMVFLYTYYYKWRGVHLVKDDEENIGHMDEQYIELTLLPGFVAEAWRTKQAALLEMIEEAEQKAADERALVGGKPKVMNRRASAFTSASGSGGGGGLLGKFSGLLGSKGGSKNSKVALLNDKVISRLQLQRLMDDAPEIQDVLGAKRAIDVIRRFRAERGPDPYTEITRLQESVILKLDSLERVGLNLDFDEVESLKMVSNGLNDALTEVQNQWRTELTSLLESCSAISNHLIDLTDRLAACTEKHNEIARDIQVAPQI